MRASSLLVTALAALAPSVARAQPAKRPERALVLIVAGRGPATASDGAQHAIARLRRAIASIGAEAPDAEALAERRDARVDGSVLSSAVALRERAEQHFRRLEADRALRLLEEASILHMRRFPDVFGDPEASRAARLAAAVYRAEGRPVRMREELRRAVAFAPEAPMDPAQFPPELVDAFETEREYVVASGVPLPGPTRLCEAARLVRASAIVTLAPAAQTSNSLGLDVYEPISCERHAVALSLLDDEADARRAASAILVPTAATAAQTVVLVRPSGPVPLPRERPPTPTPWYGRWYTIASAGALVVGGVVTALLLTQEPDRLSANARQDAIE